MVVGSLGPSVGIRVQPTAALAHPSSKPPIDAPVASVRDLVMVEAEPGMKTDPFGYARYLVDLAHAADPATADEGRPAELVYADRMENWVIRLIPDATPLLRLAARCQHLERWKVPRETFPMDRDGYNAWRQELYRKQAERAREILLEAGVTTRDADDVATWVSKTGLRRNAGTQALEDAACLVFLEYEIESFAARHSDYPTEKTSRILRRIWSKMSDSARAHALAIEMPSAIRRLLEEAVA